MGVTGQITSSEKSDSTTKKARSAIFEAFVNMGRSAREQYIDVTDNQEGTTEKQEKKSSRSRHPANIDTESEIYKKWEKDFIEHNPQKPSPKPYTVLAWMFRQYETVPSSTLASLKDKIVGYKNATKELGDIDAIFTRIDSVKRNDKIAEVQKRVLIRNLLILGLGYSKDTIHKCSSTYYFVYHSVVSRLGKLRSNFLFIGDASDLSVLFNDLEHRKRFDLDDNSFQYLYGESWVDCILITDSLNLGMFQYKAVSGTRKNTQQLDASLLYNLNDTTMKCDSKYLNENSAEMKERPVNKLQISNSLLKYIRDFKADKKFHSKENILRLFAILGYSTLGIYTDDCYLIRGNTLYDTVLVVFDSKSFFHSNNFTDTLNAFKFRTLRLNSNIKVAVFCSDAVIWCKYNYAVTLVHWKFMDETVIAHNLEFLSRDKIFQEYENNGILCNVTN